MAHKHTVRYTSLFGKQLIVIFVNIYCVNGKPDILSVCLLISLMKPCKLELAKCMALMQSPKNGFSMS